MSISFVLHLLLVAFLVIAIPIWDRRETKRLKTSADPDVRLRSYQKTIGWHRGRLQLTPGMTGQWQILGSSRIPLHEMVAIDYLYVANWSFWADVKIMLRTIPYVLGRQGM